MLQNLCNIANFEFLDFDVNLRLLLSFQMILGNIWTCNYLGFWIFEQNNVVFYRKSKRDTNIPPTAKPGVLDEASKADKWIDKIKIRRKAHFLSFFAHI